MTRLLAICLLICFSWTSSAFAQQEPKKTSTAQTEAEQITFDLMINEQAATNRFLKESITGTIDENDKSMKALSRAYIRAASFAQPTEAVIYDALKEHLKGQVNAKSAAQVSQTADSAQVRLNCLQVAQNGRIIQLLEYIAARMPKDKMLK